MAKFWVVVGIDRYGSNLVLNLVFTAKRFWFPGIHVPVSPDVGRVAACKAYERKRGRTYPAAAYMDIGAKTISPCGCLDFCEGLEKGQRIRGKRMKE